MNRLSTSDRLVQRLLNIIYWLGIGALIGSYIRLACINQQPVQLKIYNNIQQMEQQYNHLEEDSEEN